MSSSVVIKTIAITCTGLLTGYWGMKIIQSDESGNFDRSIASSPILKMGADHISRDYYDIQIKNDIVAEKISETSVIKVIITAKKDLPAGLQYKWQLHKDMTANDILEGPLPAMLAGSKTEYNLRVVGFSKEINSHINFLVYGQLGNHNLHRSVITSSRPEDSFEYIVEKAARLEKETGKIQKLSNGKSVRKKFDLNKVIK